MAKTNDPQAAVEPGPQAPRELWSPEALKAALVRGTLQDKVAALHQAGILDEKGQLSKNYENWGDRLTRAGNYEPR